MKRIVDNLKAWIQRSNRTMIELIIGVLIISGCIVIPGAIISGHILSFCLGTLFGTAYAVFMIIHMTQTIEASLDMPGNDGTKYMRKGYALRLIVTIVVIIAGLKVPFFHFVAVFIAMMSVKISVWIRPLVQRLMAKIFKQRKVR